jgi:hypothetical protein
MSLAKTEKGRSALLNRDTSLGPRERQILVMCDGKRKYVDFLQFFGDDSKIVLNRLVSQGYMLDVDSALTPLDAMTSTGTFRASGLGRMAGLGDSAFEGFDDSSGFGQSDRSRLTQPAPLTVAASRPSSSLPTDTAQKLAPAAPTRSRRSIAATKMYMIDMLQLLRDMDSSSFAVSIQTSHDEPDLVMNVLAALRYITRKSGQSYGQRVSERLGNMLPEAYLPDLDFMNAELFGEQ